MSRPEVAERCEKASRAILGILVQNPRIPHPHSSWVLSRIAREFDDIAKLAREEQS